MRAWRTKAVLILTLWLIGGGARTGVTADWSVVPSLDLRTEFNSNINFSYEKLSDYIFRIRPGLDFAYATETSQLQALFHPTGWAYVSHRNLDTIDQNYQISGRYQVMPRLNLLLNASYIVDSSLSQELTTSGLFIGRQPRESIALSPGFGFALTERLLFNAGYSFNQVSYTDPDLRNYTTQGANGGLNYLLSNEKTTLLTTLSLRDTRYPGGDYTRSLGTYGGFNHKFSETWDVNLMGGVNFSELSFKTAVFDSSTFPFFSQVRQQRQVSHSVQPYVDVSTRMRWTRASIVGGYNRDQSASAYGGLYETNRVYLNLSYDFTEKLRGTCNGFLSFSQNSSEHSDVGQTYFSINPQLNYKITEKLTLSPGYSYGLREDQGVKRTTDQHVVWLSLNYSYPLHSQY